MLGEEGPEDVHSSLAEVCCLAVVLVAEGHQVEKLGEIVGEDRGERVGGKVKLLLKYVRETLEADKHTTRQHIVLLSYSIIKSVGKS